MNIGPTGWMLLGAACWLAGPGPRSGASHRVGRHAALLAGLRRGAPAGVPGAVPAGVGQDAESAGGSVRACSRWPSTQRLPALAVVAAGIIAISALGLVAGLVLAAATAPLVRATVLRLQAAVPTDADPRLPVTLDLLATVLRAGQPLSNALDAVAPIAGSPIGAQLRGVSRMMRLGASAEVAWAALRGDPTLSPVARIATRSADSGIRLAAECTGLAAELRSIARSTAQARAQRVGVFAMAPLGLCFLPAFVCLGVVPVVAGIAGTVLGGLP